MKQQQLSDALNLLDEDLLLETDRIRNRSVWMRFIRYKGISAAACLFLVAATGWGLHQLLHTGIDLPAESTVEITDGDPSDTGVTPQLPVISLESWDWGGMGFEGYMAYDISDLVSANPWDSSVPLETLPVFKNKLTVNKDHLLRGGDFDRMEEVLKDVAGRLGLDSENLTITDDAPTEEERQKSLEKFKLTGGEPPEGYYDPTRLMTEADGVGIEIAQSLTATISFEPEVTLPDGYNFTHFASYTDCQKTADWLLKQYSGLIDMEQPTMAIDGGDYNIYRQQKYQIAFYDASGSYTDQLLNYNFNQVVFYCGDDGKMSTARIYQPDLSQKVGDYPILSVEEATQQLSQGNCISSVPSDAIPSDEPAKVELVYRTGDREAYFLPYYRFYLELPSMEEEDGLKTYGAFYVPAVRPEYLEDVPLWDGSF